MKRWQIIVVIVTSLVTVGLASCSTAAGGGETANQRLSEVRKGALTVSVSGSGNIETDEDAKLSFGVNGRIEKIYVEEGDQVSKGDILAKLETDVLELARTRAQVALTKAQVALTQAQVALTQAQLTRQTAEFELELTMDKKDTLELALLNAEINFDQAKYNLEQTRDLYTWSDIKTAKADVDDAERYLEDLLDRVGKFLPKDEEGNYPNILEYVFEEDYPKPPGYEFWQEDLVHAQRRLNAAEDRLEAMLSYSDTEEVAIKRRQVEAAEMGVAQAQKNLDKVAEEIAIKELQVEIAKDSVGQAQQSVELTRQSVEEAQQSLEQAQKNLDKVTITAPFDGVVADVVPEEGDTVNSAAQIIYLVDPTTMELVLKLDEMDVPGIMLNQEAIISVDSLPGVNFEGRVTSIYPTPTVVGGVVLYKTKISFNVPDNSGIKVGMSAMADIVVSETNNVMLVPKQAIEEDGQGGTQVSVIVNDQIQKRPVVTGRSDGLYTEILSGVSEGEAVLVNNAR